MSDSSTSLPRTSLKDTVRIVTGVLLPHIAEGLIVRRPPVLRIAESLDLDRRANQLLHQLHDRYGPGPLCVPLPRRRIALVLDPAHAERVLAESPDPFAPATMEKHGSLSHFEPHAVLASPTAMRAERRVFNETVLQPRHPSHEQAGPFLTKTATEATELVERVGRNRPLTWHEFSDAMWKAIRRVVLGDGARDDDELTLLLASLRRDANWSYLRRKRRTTYDQFMTRLTRHLDQAEPGSLGQLVRSTPATRELRPDGQVPHWLFAFDAAVIAAFKALALVAIHPEQYDQLRAELADQDLRDPEHVTGLARLRATMLESLRLWPTALLIMRDTTSDTLWGDARLPAGTAITMVASFFHRHPQVLDDPDHYRPEIWLTGQADRQWALMPFSRGPAECPGRNIVLLVTTALLGHLLQRRFVTLTSRTRLSPDRPLPCAVNHTTLRFTLH